MTLGRLARTGAVVALATAATLATLAPADAHRRPAAPTGTTSLATVLAADGAGFDRNPRDYDILDNAVSAVLKAKPTSPVAVLADGDTALTAFLPTDRAFRQLAVDLTGHRYRSESKVFTVLATELGVETIEDVLLYHVVPGAILSYRQALRADGAVLTTALTGSTVRVDVVRCAVVKLVDADRDARNPVVVARDLNAGNVQIAHGIDRVLRPVDL
ncbi:Uncaracterized surface protein containing fasciclin (FAS1) repeats [Friedmanniella luteola]|uniref:Uncaracterized surface protein containing fasciclin (FAS1) repeats n=1 Tax=Friedmanniella luteola TaxID=546871 RepID=A0A1H1W215_9ACTN|nr:fasciclin domain-containing protein [Friedmanniella luteola]SDS91065.1 Uncaracterized surface protein containing fasciclin (FAS1) repeats [Friedmanniella luteola]